MNPINPSVTGLYHGHKSSSAAESKAENSGFLSKLVRNINIFKLFTSNSSNSSTVPVEKSRGEYNLCVGNLAKVKGNEKIVPCTNKTSGSNTVRSNIMVSEVKLSCDKVYHDHIVKSPELLALSGRNVNLYQIPSQHPVANMNLPRSKGNFNTTTRQSMAAVGQPNPVKNIFSTKSSNVIQTNLNTGGKVPLKTVPKAISYKELSPKKEIPKLSTPMRTSTKDLTPQKDIRYSTLQDIGVDKLASKIHGLSISSKASPSKRSAYHDLPKVTLFHSRATVRYYKTIPLEPQVHEILSKPPVDIEPNVVEGPYQSTEHYLNVQLKLLREDFIRPLREGILQFKRDISDFGEVRKNQNVTLYPHCRFICMSARRKVVGYEFCFDASYQSVNNRRKTTGSLMNGTLLAFSCDNFKTFFFGVVAQTDEHDMIYRKVITVELCNGKKLGFSEFNRRYVMIEPSSFYAPYYFVMKSLQTFSNENFPFKKYVINATKHINNPVYLSKQTNLSNSILKAHDLGNNVEDELGFNSIQFEAYKTALTKELAIIQGPPGTGKTFVGLKIVESFLKNKPLKEYIDGPIVIVCFTNHALDQFIEGVLQYTQNVCRLGFSRKNDNVKPYNYMEMIETFQAIKEVAKSMQFVRKDKKEFVKIEDFHTLFSPNQNGSYTMKVRSFKTDMYEKRKYDEQLMKAYFLMFVKSPLNRPDEHKKGPIRNKCRRLEKQLERISMKISLINSFSGILHVNNLEDFMDDISLFVLGDPKKLCSWLTEGNSVQELGQPKKKQMLNESDDDSDMRSSSNESGKVKKSVFFVLELVDIQNEIENTEGILQDYKEKSNTFRFEGENHPLEMDLNEKIIECSIKLRKLRNSHVIITNLLNNLKEADMDTKEIERTIVKNISCKEDLHGMCLENRWKLYCFWVESYRRALYSEMERAGLEYKEVLCKFEEAIRHPELVAILQTKDVVAMTTTKAAKIQSVLYDLKPKIVIIEEAAEVLETHIMASLSKYCEHMVLIGDHKQLRPSTSVHDLAAKYAMDVSLFERLTLNGLHHVTLKVQHRMRPEICDLLTPTIYSKLINHGTVEKFPNVTGMTSNVQFFDHKFLEGKNIAENSTWNEFEVNVLLNLSVYLLQQSYSPRDITIIAAYKGQVELFQKAIDERYRKLSKILVTSIDGYQGEENRIILLSLVRSNIHKNVGFLKTPNRVCVALSRAKEGLFIMGNMENLSHESELWRDIKGKLVAARSIGPSFRLKCGKHRSSTVIQALGDFDRCCCLRR